MKKILIVNQNAGYLTIDVANAFCKEYDQVVLFCGRLRVYERSLDDKVKVVKTVPYIRKSVLARIFTWGLCTLHLLFLMVIKFRSYHILYYTNPPISYFVSLFTKHVFAIVVFDVYPETLKLIGIKESNLIYKVYKKINRKVFASAVTIITLSEGMATILQNYVKGEKIKVVPLWAAFNNIQRNEKVSNPLEVRFDLKNKFIILYAGTMGIANNLEMLLHAAREFNKTDILFLFAGDGEQKKKFMELAHSLDLSNVIFLPRQNPGDTHHLFNTAKLAVVALEPQASLTAVPSKTFNYLVYGLPILAICDTQSELARLIQKHRIGFSVSGEDVSTLINIIQSVHNDPDLLKTLSDNCITTAKIYNFNQANEYVF